MKEPNRKYVRDVRVTKIKQVLCDDKSSKGDYRYAMLLGILELIESQKKS